MKKLLKIVVIVFLVLLAALFTIPFLFKGKIIAIVKSEINKSVNAQVDFSDVDISLLRKFPRVAVAVEGLQVIGNGKFASDTLLAAKNIDVSLNLMSFIRGDKMTIYSIEVNQPRIQAVVAKDGQANWDIMKEDSLATAPEDSAAYNLELKKYAIYDGYIQYRDSAGAMSSEIFGLQHEGSGDFNQEIFTLATKTSADAVNFTYGLIPYLVNVKTMIDADIQIDNRDAKYSFKTDRILLNQLKIASEGFFQLVNDSTYNMDISFNAPSTDFKDILSLIPVVYQKDFEKITTSGQAVFNGVVKGTMSGDKLPAFHIFLDVSNGYFQYPDLPAPVKNINVAVKIDNPDGIPDHTVIDIPQAHFELENDPFNLRLLVKTPMSNMWVDGEAIGRLDLSKISRIVKLDDGTSIKGLLAADVAVKGYVDAAQKQQFDQFTASGTIGLREFSYASGDYPDGVDIDRLMMVFNPKNVTLNELAGKYLNTRFEANGSINNLLGYALKDQPLDGIVNVKADKMNVNEWMGTEDSTETETASGAFVVPANLDLLLNARVDEVKYDNLLMQQVSGSLKIAEETVKLADVKGNALDGTIIVNGSYSTRHDKKNPAIALQYDVENLDIQKTFNTFNTVQKLMPIGKFLGGSINSTLSMTGKLGEDMFPDLNTLTGEGTIFLIHGLLTKFEPVDRLATRLNINELKNLSLREVREHFEFSGGKVFVKPFSVKVNNIQMEIGGMHGFDQSLDYAIQLRLPRSLMGDKGNEIVNNLISQAATKGVPVKLSDTVNLNVKMLGTITKPEINLDLRESAGSVAEEIKTQAKEFVQAKIDSTKQAVSDTLQSIKKEVLQEASSRLKDALFNKKDTTAADTTENKPANPVDKLKESGKGLLEDLNPFKKKK